jgi:hypothetical protein
MLVAWKHRTFWTLFEIRHAELATVNYKIDFSTAMQENLLGMLAGDFSYRLVVASHPPLLIDGLIDIVPLDVPAAGTAGPDLITSRSFVI